MPENSERTNFAGTYYDRDQVTRISRWLKIAAWVVAGVYLFQFLMSTTIFMLQMARQMIYIAGPTDLLQQVFWLVQPTLAGIIFFVVLQALSQALLILMDLEDNTRRAARK